MTFSIVARCSKTGMFGVALTSSSPAVGARCPHVRSGVGAASTQNVTDPDLGPRLLDSLAKGRTTVEAIMGIVQTTPHIEYRQLLCVGRSGDSAVYTGAKVLGIWGEAHAKDVAAAGNLLATPHVPQAMVDCFLSAEGDLGDRLIAALRAGLEAGGEAGPVHAAGLKIADRMSWPVAEIRCDWTDGCPVENIERAWAVYKPQMADYVQRATNPTLAPSYGVLGDE